MNHTPIQPHTQKAEGRWVEFAPPAQKTSSTWVELEQTNIACHTKRVWPKTRKICTQKCPLSISHDELWLRFTSQWHSCKLPDMWLCVASTSASWRTNKKLNTWVLPTSSNVRQGALFKHIITGREFAQYLPIHKHLDHMVLLAHVFPISNEGGQIMTPKPKK